MRVDRSLRCGYSCALGQTVTAAEPQENDKRVQLRIVFQSFNPAHLLYPTENASFGNPKQLHHEAWIQSELKKRGQMHRKVEMPLPSRARIQDRLSRPRAF